MAAKYKVIICINITSIYSNNMQLGSADLARIGGLQTLLRLLGSAHGSLRWRAAEVVAACVQINPPVQVLIWRE